jgi:ribonuclease BN (tRNA processing enzyme)
MTLRLTILGSSGSYPGPGRAASGYLFQTDTTNIWVDAGSGTLANLQRYISISEIDALVLSHEHPDHCGDVDGLLVATQSDEIAEGSIDIYAPTGLREHIYFVDKLDGKIKWHDCEPGDKISVKDFTITFARSDHGPLTLAMKIEADGRVVAYTSDTGPRFSVAEFGSQFDLLLSEATDTAEKEEQLTNRFHLSGRQAAVMAKAVDAKRLIITHVRPRADSDAVLAEAKAEFANTELAEENRTYEI